MSPRMSRDLWLAALLTSCSNVGDVPPWWPGMVPMDSELWCTSRSAAQDASTPWYGQGRKPESIDQTVGSARPKFEGCYDEFIKRVGFVDASFEIQFLIEPSGVVSDACVWDTDLKDQTLAACMLQTYRALRFESAAVSTTVRYPVAFDSGLSSFDDSRRYPFGKEPPLRQPLRIAVPPSRPR